MSAALSNQDSDVSDAESMLEEANHRFQRMLDTTLEEEDTTFNVLRSAESLSDDFPLEYRGKGSRRIAFDIDEEVLGRQAVVKFPRGLEKREFNRSEAQTWQHFRSQEGYREDILAEVISLGKGGRFLVQEEVAAKQAYRHYLEDGVLKSDWSPGSFLTSRLALTQVKNELAAYDLNPSDLDSSAVGFEKGNYLQPKVYDYHWMPP
ncbi:MAG: hypothetical protein ABEJ56_05950 [Candidatus Nanohaloarchaea archaeon]